MLFVAFDARVVAEADENKLVLCLPIGGHDDNAEVVNLSIRF
jgi:hypothetical protein